MRPEDKVGVATQAEQAAVRAAAEATMKETRKAFKAQLEGIVAAQAEQLRQKGTVSPPTPGSSSDETSPKQPGVALRRFSSASSTVSTVSGGLKAVVDTAKGRTGVALDRTGAALKSAGGMIVKGAKEFTERVAKKGGSPILSAEENARLLESVRKEGAEFVKRYIVWLVANELVEIRPMLEKKYTKDIAEAKAKQYSKEIQDKVHPDMAQSEAWAKSMQDAIGVVCAIVIAEHGKDPSKDIAEICGDQKIRTQCMNVAIAFADSLMKRDEKVSDFFEIHINNREIEFFTTVAPELNLNKESEDGVKANKKFEVRNFGETIVHKETGIVEYTGLKFIKKDQEEILKTVFHKGEAIHCIVYKLVDDLGLNKAGYYCAPLDPNKPAMVKFDADAEAKVIASEERTADQSVKSISYEGGKLTKGPVIPRRPNTTSTTKGEEKPSLPPRPGKGSSLV